MLKHGGIPTEDSYGPYLGQDGYCNLNQSSVGLKIKGFVNVTSGRMGGGELTQLELKTELAFSFLRSMTYSVNSFLKYVCLSDW